MSGKEAFLEKQLERVDKWLHFAEAKNAALIAFNIALLAVEFPEGRKCISTTINILLIISIVVAFASFWPNLSNKLIKIWRFKSSGSVNNIYYSDIASYVSGDRYLDSINETYFGEKTTNFSILEKDYANEILINSQITVVKYNLFRIALIVDVISAFMLIVFIYA